MNLRVKIVIRRQNEIQPRHQSIFISEDYDSNFRMAKHVYGYVRAKIKEQELFETGDRDDYTDID